MRFNEFNNLLEKEDITAPVPDRLSFIIDQLKSNPEVLKKVYRIIKLDMDSTSDKGIDDFLNPSITGNEKDQTFKGVLKPFIQALNNTPGDYDDLKEFLQSYGKVSYIDTKVLLSDGYSEWSSWLKGSGKVSNEFIHKLYANLFDLRLNISNSNRGPGEIGLALLSPNITVATVGDLLIDGTEVEVKGESSTGGGRLKNSNADYGTPNLDSVYQKFNIPNEQRPSRLPSANPNAKVHFQDIAMNLEKLQKGAGTAYIEELFSKTFINGDVKLISNMISNWNKLDRQEVSRLAYEISYSSYANILLKKGFSKFLFLKIKGEKSLAFEVNNYKEYVNFFKLGSLDFGDNMNGPAVQVSMK